MATQRTHVTIPEDLVSEIDDVVGKRGRSQFLVEAARVELQRLRQLNALRNATGAWKVEDHPELARGALAFQKSLRAESEARRKKQIKRRPRR